MAATHDCPGDMAERMCKVLPRQWVGVRVCHLLLLFAFGICQLFAYKRLKTKENLKIFALKVVAYKWGKI